MMLFTALHTDSLISHEASGIAGQTGSHALRAFKLYSFNGLKDILCIAFTLIRWLQSALVLLFVTCYMQRMSEICFCRFYMM